MFEVVDIAMENIFYSGRQAALECKSLLKTFIVKTMTFDVEAGNNIKSVKVLIQFKEPRIPADQQSLRFEVL